MHRYWDDYSFNHMMDFSQNGGGWFLVFGIIRLVIIVAVIVFIVKLLIKNSHGGSHSAGNQNSAIEILKERYAKGEIDEEEYKNKLNKLKE